MKWALIMMFLFPTSGGENSFDVFAHRSMSLRTFESRSDCLKADKALWAATRGLETKYQKVAHDCVQID